ncbi:hypothetical protein GQ55_1G237300 [Panicum hallii var. hallii]|uniref:Uncharacterized protein n=1 Tax=Panicum hallii var. hallii TaxID=1504633 RepID=A0A2T7F6V8_9POAL|nr:hypothetical protein GQ55_1G237300 [Panicum hallii var. hallii]
MAEMALRIGMAGEHWRCRAQAWGSRLRLLGVSGGMSWSWGRYQFCSFSERSDEISENLPLLSRSIIASTTKSSNDNRTLPASDANRSSRQQQRVSFRCFYSKWFFFLFFCQGCLLGVPINYLDHCQRPILYVQFLLMLVCDESSSVVMLLLSRLGTCHFFF